MNNETDWKELLATMQHDDEPGRSVGTRENDGWLRVDEREDLVNSLEHALEYCIHGAFGTAKLEVAADRHPQRASGSLVSALTGTDGLRVLEKKCMDEWLDWHEKRRAGEEAPPPKEYLASPLELYSRAKRSTLCASTAAAR